MVAYATLLSAGEAIKVLDILNRRVLPWTVTGTYPNWSPSGVDIAFINLGGVLMLVNPGGIERRLSEFGYNFNQEPFSWSQDGRWILARAAGFLSLVQYPSGTVLPLRHFTDLRAPALRLAH